MRGRSLLIAALLLAGARSDALPTEYTRNASIRTDISVAGDDIRFDFGFKDPGGTYREWSWNDSLSRIDTSARAFGLPGADPDHIHATEAELRAGYFREDARVGVTPDYSALVAKYSSTVDALHQRWKSQATASGMSTRQSIELLLTFLQDFPYGRPERVYENRIIGGLFVAPLIFKNGWADCDSKSLLMATVLAKEPEFTDRLAMILVPGHALLGIEMPPGPFDELITYQNRNYVVAEPTGLARTPLGRKNSPYSEMLLVEPLRPVARDERKATPAALANATVVYGAPRETRPSSPSSPSGELRALTRKDCPLSASLVDRTSKTTGIRTQTCYSLKNDQLIKNGPEVEFDPQGKITRRADYVMGVPKP